MRRSFLILMYHRIQSAVCPLPPNSFEEKRYSISFEDFSRQMIGMREAGFRGASLAHALGARAGTGDGRERTVVITFDDGNRSDHACALPVLAANGFTATFFVTGDRIGRPDGLTESQIRDLCSAGMDVGSHGMTHRFLPGLSSGEQEDEGRRSRDLLGGITGLPVRFFSLPGGRCSSVTLDILRALSYAGVCTSAFGYNRVGGDSFRLRRIPITRSTSQREFLGYLRRSPGVIYPGYIAAWSRELARGVLGERLYLGLRARLIRE